MAAAGGTASRTTSMNHGGLSMFGGLDSPSRAGDWKSQAESGAVTPTSSIKVNPMSTPSTTGRPHALSMSVTRRDKPESTKVGWLEKFSVGRGVIKFKNWKKRFFTVDCNGLNYSKSDKKPGAPRTYIPFVTKKTPEVSLSSVFLLSNVNSDLHPEAQDPSKKYLYFGIRFEENKRSFVLLMRTVDSSTRERWVRFLAQLVPCGVPYNLGVPPAHPQDPTLQRLYDPEDLDERERKALRKVVLDWDEGYQEYRYRKIVLKALATAAATTTPPNRSTLTPNSSVPRLGSGGTDGSGPKGGKALSFGSSGGGTATSRNISTLSQPLNPSSSQSQAGKGASSLDQPPSLGSGKSIASAFHLGGDVTDPDSPYFTGITYIGGASSLSTAPATLASAPNSASYLARCFGFGGPQQGWEMQDGDKEDEDDEEGDFGSFGPHASATADDIVITPMNSPPGHLGKLVNSAKGSRENLQYGAALDGSIDDLGVDNVVVAGRQQADDLPISSRGNNTPSHSPPVSPNVDKDHHEGADHFPHVTHHYAQRRLSTPPGNGSGTTLGGATPPAAEGTTRNSVDSSVTVDSNEGPVHSPGDYNDSSMSTIRNSNPTSNRYYDSHRARGATTIAYQRGSADFSSATGSPTSIHQRSRADSSIVIESGSSTQNSFGRDPRRRPTLGPDI